MAHALAGSRRRCCCGTSSSSGGRSDDCGPSTSGRSHVSSAPVQRRGACRSRHRPVAAAGMPAMYNTDPFPLPARLEGVVQGARTTATPRLTPERVLQRLAESPSAAAAAHFGAFYSSELGGIVTEPGFMVVGIDDQMAQHGDAVTDALHLVSGYLYQLDEHLARLATSAEMAGLPLPMSQERLRRVLLDTAAASLKQNGMLHVWLSRGRGGTGLAEAPGPALYALLSSESVQARVDRDNGLRAVTTPVDPLPFYFSAMRSASAMQQAVAKLEAATRGADLAVFVDPDDVVLYGPDCSIALLTEEGVLVVPPDEGGLAGMAARNIASLVPQHKSEDLPITSVERRAFTTGELAGAREAFAVSTRHGVVGISHFNDKWVGDHEFEGQAGPVSLALNALLELDREPVPGSAKHTEVPYGYLTGMRSQLQ